MKTAPPGTSLVRALGVGSVFDVAEVRGAGERRLIAKRPRVSSGPEGAEALRREAMVLATAHTTHLPTLVASGVDGESSYVVEGYASGLPLRELVQGHGPPLDAATFSAIALASSGALSRLHALIDGATPLAVVHGDISPDNLFYAEAPSHVTFVDLSSATYRDATLPVFSGDRGTLPYAAPELARGEMRAGQESDTYALAAVLLALAVGPICEANTAASRLLEIGLRGVMRERVDARSDLPPRSRAALKRALAFDPKARLRSAAELAHEFLSASSGVAWPT